MRNDELAIIRSESLAIDGYARQQMPTLRDIIAVLFRQRVPLFAAFAFIIVAGALSGLWVPKYEAQMKILVLRQRSDAVVTSSANAPSQYSSDQVSEEDLDSEVELLNSKDLLRKVVLKAGLIEKSDSSGGGNGEIDIARAIRKLSKALKIEPLPKTHVILVRYRARNPEMAAGVLKVLAAEYTEKHLEVHRSSAEFKFFDQQTEQYQEGLDQAQRKLTEFTKGTGVVSAQLERDSALRQANDFDTTAHQAQTGLIETERRVSELQGQLRSLEPRMTTVIRTSDNPQLLEQLKSTLLNLQLKRTELLTKYAPTYRLVEEVDRQIADATNAINSALNNPLLDKTSDPNPDYQWVQAELTKAQADLIGLKARSDSAASISRQYLQAAQRLDKSGLVQQDLLRAAKTQEENYLLYVHKREEARISDALDQRGILNVALAEQPLVPALPGMSVLNVVLLTLLLAITFSLSVAFVADLTDPSFRTPDELSHYLGMPVLAALPKGGR